MLEVDLKRVSEQTKKIEYAYKKGLGEPLFFSKFISDTYSKINPEGFVPYEVKIPKPLSSLTQGDFEPERIIQVKNPILDHNGIPMWTQSAISGCRIPGFGYKNGDSRYPSEIRFDDKNIHGFLVGVTGHGKSVAINASIQSIMKHYAPWEVRFLMADAKIVEFRRYAISGPRIPHIKSIAATDDSDYIISVLESGIKDMKALNAAISEAGYRDYEQFREKTGLAVPRNIIVIDEWQTMVNTAGKKAKDIYAMVDSFGRLGRNTGYHLFLSSQEIGDTPAPTMKNIQMRISLGADAQTSTKILGNDEAKVNYGKKGRLIVNMNSPAGDKKDNIHFRVPFQTDDEFAADLQSFETAGKQVNFFQPLSFYDGEKYLFEKDYEKIIKSKVTTPFKIFLGEPSFVMNDPDGDGFLSMKFKGTDTENIAIYGNNNPTIERLGKMLKYNMEGLGDKVNNQILNADDEAVRTFEFDPSWRVHEGRSYESTGLPLVKELIFSRKLYLDVDKIVFSGKQNTVPQVADFLVEVFTETSKFNTELNRKRASAMFHLVTTQFPALGYHGCKLSVDPEGEFVKDDSYNKLSSLLQKAFPYYEGTKSLVTEMTRDNLLPVFIWIVGLDKMIGIGRSPRPRYKTELKELMQDCHMSNVRFISTFTSPEEFGSEFKSVFRYSIMDGLTDSNARKIGADYPETMGSVLSAFYDSNSDNKSAVKFKKMAFAGEVLK